MPERWTFPMNVCASGGRRTALSPAPHSCLCQTSEPRSLSFGLFVFSTTSSINIPSYGLRRYRNDFYAITRLCSVTTTLNSICCCLYSASFVLHIYVCLGPASPLAPSAERTLKSPHLLVWQVFITVPLPQAAEESPRRRRVQRTLTQKEFDVSITTPTGPFPELR